MCWIIRIIYFYRDYLHPQKVLLNAIKSVHRGVTQPGSASGLGPEGRRFKSCRPDHYGFINKKCIKSMFFLKNQKINLILNFKVHPSPFLSTFKKNFLIKKNFKDFWDKLEKSNLPKRVSRNY